MNPEFVIGRVWQGYGNSIDPKIMALVLLKWEAEELGASLGNGAVEEEALQTVTPSDPHSSSKNSFG